MEFYLSTIFSCGGEQAEICGLFSDPIEAMNQIKNQYDSEKAQKIHTEDDMEKNGVINIYYNRALFAQVIKMTVNKKVNFYL